MNILKIPSDVIRNVISEFLGDADLCNFSITCKKINHDVEVPLGKRREKVRLNKEIFTGEAEMWYLLKKKDLEGVPFRKVGSGRCYKVSDVELACIKKYGSLEMMDASRERNEEISRKRKITREKNLEKKRARRNEVETVFKKREWPLDISNYSDYIESGKGKLEDIVQSIEAKEKAMRDGSSLRSRIVFMLQATAARRSGDARVYIGEYIKFGDADGLLNIFYDERNIRNDYIKEVLQLGLDEEILTEEVLDKRAEQIMRKYGKIKK